MPFPRLILLLLIVPALLFAAGDNNFKLTLDKFRVGAKMEATADKIINIPEDALSIQPGFPLKENKMYLRQKKGGKEYKWFMGDIDPENFKKVHAFNLAENHLKAGEVVLTRFYSVQNSRPYQDETDIYFDKEYMYSTRLPKLFFYKNGRWQMLKESVPPAIVSFADKDGNVEVASDNLDFKKGVRYLHPVEPGYYTVTYMKEGCLPYAEIVYAKNSSVTVIKPRMISLKTSEKSAPKLTVNLQSIQATKDLPGTEALYDQFVSELQKDVNISDSVDFYKVYPSKVSAASLGIAESDEEYMNYVSRYTSQRNEAYGMWRKSQLAGISDMDKAFKHKLDSLQALQSRMYVWPNTVNPVYPVVIPEYSADLSPAVAQAISEPVTPSPLADSAAKASVPADSAAPADSSAAAPAAAAPVAMPPPEKLELEIGHPGDRYDFKWIGKALGLNTENLIALIRNGKVKMIITLQNDKPVWVIQNGIVTSRHHYRYVGMEFEFNGQIYPGEGSFILPNYILLQHEVQDWLNPKPVEVSSSSEEVVESSSSAPDFIMVQQSSSSEDNSYIRDEFHGDVVLVDSGSFRYKGHIVEMSGFAIHRTEVTQKFFAQVMGRRDTVLRIEDRSKFKGDQKPVHNVTWQVAKEFCEQINGDLPSEAQWEFAGRADNNEGAIWVMDDVPDPGQYAVYKENSYKLDKKDPDYGPHVVASKKPNAWGIYDMSGNVSEWTRDRHFPISFWQEKSNPTGAMFGFLKVFKGGSWKDSEKKLNLVERDDEDPRYWSDAMGFRCVFPREAFQKKGDKKSDE